MNSCKTLSVLASLLVAHALPAAEMPRLEQQGSATQLIVDDAPFLIRGGELGNSTASNVDHLGQYWEKFRTLKLNTIVAPVYWDLIEPVEGEFDFSLVDGLIEDARAFRALMRHLLKTDGKHRTVLMVQPENEIGMVDYSRDYSPTANESYSEGVPAELIAYLVANQATLAPELTTAWAGSGFARSGNWAEVFGDSPQGEEIFMAWHYARYTEQVASAGKAEYPLPMYVNAALIRPGYQPGQHISAGPLPHLIDIWRAGAPSIDFIVPDIYFPDFTEWTARYTRSGNPLFIPRRCAVRRPP